MAKKTQKIEVQGTEIAIINEKEDDYISLTDIARYKDPQRTDYIIQNWMRNRNTIEFLGVWEQLYNPNFNPIEFEGIKNQAGLNRFVLTAKRWIEATGVVDISSQQRILFNAKAAKTLRRKGWPGNAEPQLGRMKFIIKRNRNKNMNHETL
ncbi:MAG: KilA-N domain-containing protein [Sedimentisphaerales bacterium]|nr:KilA-N domain-containing protein [Sedimentisphaerales bacterium]MBN2842119.1 KilA-N domain-containing protein [Sedimentisphaerales bacterium]